MMENNLRLLHFFFFFSNILKYKISNLSILNNSPRFECLNITDFLNIVYILQYDIIFIISKYITMSAAKSRIQITSHSADRRL